jgi:NAD(P)H-dependent flavin oxidoreductase YrpB (nitropropane dioxygenase family)
VAAPSTAFTELVGCRLPIQLAPMGGGVAGPELAVAVCAAGGLGMVSSAHPTPLDAQLRFLAEHAGDPCGVGFFAFELADRLAELELASATARVVDVFWGDPDAKVVERIHAGGALGFWQVGSADEAVAAADAGCDAVVVQGVEAGGHVRGTTPLLELLAEVTPRVCVPVVAAGGIAAAASARRAFEAGASALRIGTRLLATSESAAHKQYLIALIRARPDDTEITTAFGVGWPDAPHRVLSLAVKAAARAKDEVGEAHYGDRTWPIPRHSVQPPSTFCSGDVIAMALYAGTGVGDIVDVRPAADIIRQLLED